jgi:hypothetical protein
MLKKLSLLVFIISFTFFGSLKAHPTTYASIGDFVWVDQNANGIQDVGEPGVANVTVKLLSSSGAVIATTTTNSSGKYTFTNVYVPSCAKFRVQFGTPGQYTWTKKQAPGSTVTNNSNADANGLSDEFEVCAGDNNPCIDAGILQSGSGKATIGDFVWMDLNGNGIQDAGEPGVANVTVKLLNSAGAVVATTTTNSSGIYFFSNISISTCAQYKVQFGTPGEYRWTIEAAPGSTATNNSNADANGLTPAFTVCPGDYNTCIDAGIRNISPILNPDINVTYVNVPVNGNVSTNDKVPSGSTYGTPVLNSKPIGSTATISLNTDGTYTFIANTPGVYIYNVPICSSGTTTCPSSLLTITVLAPKTNNPPVANTDIATTKINTPVTINSLANDKAGYPGGTLNASSVVVVTPPLHGTTSVNTTTGAITYTPATGYVGMDTLTYRVCDNSTPPLCATAKQIITVQSANATNTTSAADDYATGVMNTTVTGNVKTNDTDAEGNTQTVTTQTTTASGKGTLVLNADGTFTFTPVSGFTGPVSFVYTTCDNGVPQACASATLYIIIAKATPNLTPSVQFLPSITHGVQTVSVITTVAETKNVATDSTITVYVTRDPKYTIMFSPAETTVGGRAVNNSIWTLDTSNPQFYIFRTNTVLPGNGTSKFGFDLTFNPNNSNGSTTITAFIGTNSGGESTADANDNTDNDVLIYFLK